MTRRIRQAPAAPESATRFVRLAAIDAELGRLAALRKDKLALMDADTAKHALDQNMDLQKRLSTEIAAFRQKSETLEAQRLAVELADDDELSNPASHAKAAPIAPPAPWEINPAHKKRPDYSDGAKYGSPEFEAAYDAFQDWGIATVSSVYQEHNISPDSRVSFRTLAMIIGSLTGMVKFGEFRIEELENNFAKAADPLMKLADRIERGEVKPMVYRGTYREGRAYKAGDTVSHGGHLWHADRATNSRPDEFGDRSWTMAMRKPRDGKDATK